MHPRAMRSTSTSDRSASKAGVDVREQEEEVVVCAFPLGLA